MACHLTLRLLSEELAVCRLDPGAQVPAWAWRGSLVVIARTPQELSLVCAADAVPQDVRCTRGWRALMVEGPLPFDVVGVLSSLAAPLARAGVSLFAVSTHDTDYLLVQAKDLPRALAALRAAGHRLAHDR